MRSPFPTRRSNPLAPLLAGLLTLAACAEAPASAAVDNATPDRVVAGPQGAKGQFAVECKLDHLGSDDPIVHPGHVGMSHLHQFFGAVGVDANTHPEQLEGGATTCDQSSDTAAYWAPVLLNSGEPVHAIRSVAYYRAGIGVAPQDVADYPDGLMLIATHEMSFAREIADEMCFLHEGRILEQGPPAELLERPSNERTRQFLQRVTEAGRM